MLVGGNSKAKGQLRRKKQASGVCNTLRLKLGSSNGFPCRTAVGFSQRHFFVLVNQDCVLSYCGFPPALET